MSRSFTELPKHRVHRSNQFTNINQCNFSVEASVQSRKSPRVKLALIAGVQRGWLLTSGSGPEASNIRKFQLSLIVHVDDVITFLRIFGLFLSTMSDDQLSYFSEDFDWNMLASQVLLNSTEGKDFLSKNKRKCNFIW